MLLLESDKVLDLLPELLGNFPVNHLSQRQVKERAEEVRSCPLSVSNITFTNTKLIGGSHRRKCGP
jgi:hypothetical protein